MTGNYTLSTDSFPFLHITPDGTTLRSGDNTQTLLPQQITVEIEGEDISLLHLVELFQRHGKDV